MVDGTVVIPGIFALVLLATSIAFIVLYAQEVSGSSSSTATPPLDETEFSQRSTLSEAAPGAINFGDFTIFSLAQRIGITTYSSANNGNTIPIYFTLSESLALQSAGEASPSGETRSFFSAAIGDSTSNTYLVTQYGDPYVAPFETNTYTLKYDSLTKTFKEQNVTGTGPPVGTIETNIRWIFHVTSVGLAKTIVRAGYFTSDNTFKIQTLSDSGTGTVTWTTAFQTPSPRHQDYPGAFDAQGNYYGVFLDGAQTDKQYFMVLSFRESGGSLVWEPSSTTYDFPMTFYSNDLGPLGNKANQRQSMQVNPDGSVVMFSRGGVLDAGNAITSTTEFYQVDNATKTLSRVASLSGETNRQQLSGIPAWINGELLFQPVADSASAGAYKIYRTKEVDGEFAIVSGANPRSETEPQSIPYFRTTSDAQSQGTTTFRPLGAVLDANGTIGFFATNSSRMILYTR